MKKSRSDFHSVVDKFEKSKDEDLFSDTDCEVLDKRVEDLKNSWDELWREHLVNKDR